MARKIGPLGLAVKGYGTFWHTDADVNANATGAEASSDAGTVTSTAERHPSRFGELGPHGLSSKRRSLAPASVDVSPVLSGAASAGEAQAVTVTGDSNVTLAGAATAGEAQAPSSITGDASFALTTAVIAGAASAPTVTSTITVNQAGAASAGEAEAPSVTGDSTITLTGAASAGEAGTTRSRRTLVTDRAIAPTGLPKRTYGPFTRELTVTPTGAVSPAQAAFVNVISTTVRQAQLAPHGLVTKTRNFSKQVAENVNASITGALIQGQQGYPDLHQPTVYIDSAAISVSAGSVVYAEAEITGAEISAAAGTTTSAIGISASPTGAQITTGASTVTAIGGGGTDVGVTITTAASAAAAGTVTPAFDHIFSITGAQINAQASEVGLDFKTGVSPTITGAQITTGAAVPALVGPHVTILLESAKITGHAGEVEQVKHTGRSSRKHYVIEIDGEPVIVSSVAEAQRILAEVAELAEAAAERDITIDTTPATPVIKVKTGTGKASQSKAIQEAIRTTQRSVNKAYEEVTKRRRIDAEISKLLIAKIESEEEEEEALIALLLS